MSWRGIYRKPSGKRTRRGTASRRGAYTVEFAFCIPVFLLVLFAAFEFTRFTFARHALNFAAYEAARVAITPGATPQLMQQRAQTLLSKYGLEAQKISVSPNPITDQTRSVS